jgi:hypothetical protein
MVGIETLIVGCAAATAAFLLGTASVAVLAKLGISLRMAYESNGADSRNRSAPSSIPLV